MVGLPPAPRRGPALARALAAAGFWFCATPFPLTVSPAAASGAAPAVAVPDRSVAARSSVHFTLHAPAAIDPAGAAEILGLLEAGRALILAELGLALEAAAQVRVLTRQEFRALTGKPPWVRGAFDGRILVPLDARGGAGPADALRPVLLHELTHFLVRGSIPASLPPWFEEGLAERFEGSTPAAAAAWLSARGAPRFGRLEEIDRSIRAGGWREDAGHQGALLAVEALEGLAGPSAAARILSLVRSGSDFDSALAQIVPGGRSGLEARLAADGARDR